MNATKDHWELARSIQITPAREPLPPSHQGVIVARRHPTGWFISARHAPELNDTERADFEQFVMVRAYLLLKEGPRPDLWKPADDGNWRAYCLPAHINVDGAIPITA
jgi:hypothetical protein